ncbi:DsbA family protein [Marisediminicola sp. LYQ134]|uniref:DsbA family protein n=1 Tax=unclassified Marisediminicola TaxID=2618316 RepID=UPI0039839178
MTGDGSDIERMSKNQRREMARNKARALREQQRKKERRGKFLLQGGIIVGLLAVVAIVTIVVVGSIRPPGPGPANMASDGIVIGEGFTAVTTPALAADEEPVTTAVDPESDVIPIEVWVDYQCPFCADFDSANKELLETLLQEGAATIEIHPVAILDRASAGSRYSTRAANAAACVASYSPDRFWAFDGLMFENQPAEGETGLTDEQLIEITRDAEVDAPTVISECIDDLEFENWVDASTERATADESLFNEDGNFVTPTIFVAGERYPGPADDPTVFAQFVAAADGEAFTEETSPSASPSPSPSP